MPTFAAITINDGASTPVARTFAPKTLIGTEAKFVDRSSGITVGFPELMVNQSMPSKTSKIHKVRLKLTMPVMEVVNSSTYNGITPAPTKAFDMTFDGTFFLPERSSLQDRKHIMALAKNALANALLTALVETQETIY